MYRYDRDWAIGEAAKVSERLGESVSFEGFGGSHQGTETLVWCLMDNGQAVELRTPQIDCLMSLNQISEEYGCLASEKLEWAITEYREQFES